MSNEMPFLSCLPGDIPGLLRDGSIVRHNGHRAVVLQVTEGFVLVAHHASGTDEEIEVDGGTVPWYLVALDLTDSTSRIHAAWWALIRAPGVTVLLEPAEGFLNVTESRLCAAVIYGEKLNRIRIDALARLVLRLAGRKP